MIQAKEQNSIPFHKAIYKRALRTIQKLCLKILELEAEAEPKSEKPKKSSSVPLPPSSLISQTLGFDSQQEYYHSGKMITDSIFMGLKTKGISYLPFEAVLDFGCGCGRLTRHIRHYTAAKIYGVDCNAEAISWCKNSLSFCQFTNCKTGYPLHYRNNSMDLVIAESVFCHLSEQHMKALIAELRQIIKPDGILVLSAHCLRHSEVLSDSEKKQLLHGQFIVKQRAEEGTIGYQSFFSHAYVAKNTPGFNLLLYKKAIRYTCLDRDMYVLIRK